MNRKHFAMKLALMALAGMMVASPAWAEKKGKASSGPSEQETVEFINGLLACEVKTVGERGERGSNEYYVLFSAYQNSIVKANKGILLLSEKVDREVTVKAIHGKISDEPRHPDYTNDVSVNLKELDVDVALEGKNVEFKCNPNAGACIQVEAKDTQNKVEQKRYSSWKLKLCDETNAQRAAKALKHLIEISGGKKSLF